MSSRYIDELRAQGVVVRAVPLGEIRQRVLGVLRAVESVNRMKCSRRHWEVPGPLVERLDGEGSRGRSIRLAPRRWKESM